MTTDVRRSRWRAVPAARMHLWLMLVLTFTTGINDAVGYLGLDRVFTGNMTGNVVILGMALVGDTGLPVLGPALALVGFMVGAAGSGRVLRTTIDPWGARTTWLLAVVALVMFGLAGLLAVAGNHPEQSVMVTTTTLAAAAMGMQAAVARHIAVKDVTTVVVTSTITGLAADSWFGAGRPGSTARRVLAVVLILLGATAGAAALQLHLGAGLALAGVLIAVVAVVGELHARPTRRATPA
ncbi:YoaK family protein [Nocardioides sp. SOB77]|uniref:YoaK family protein n=1 Tax=Nocardioides oceani TaxID=3058369 RepID=A0ABT8FF51_9ACTN|nr:YoaK family protein [Nocardioides oceani]MDN4173186.1 YoaK family protein [Nocardioides oceani]